jgi:hypothetical protein
MPFVVRATGQGLSVLWLSAPIAAGSYTVGPRQNAAVFPTQAAAQFAADDATKSLGSLGMTFTVELAETRSLE